MINYPKYLSSEIKCLWNQLYKSLFINFFKEILNSEIPTNNPIPKTSISNTIKNEVLINQTNSSPTSLLPSPIALLNKSCNLFFTSGSSSGGNGGIQKTSKLTTTNILDLSNQQSHPHLKSLSCGARRGSLASTHADERRSLLDGSMEFTV